MKNRERALDELLIKQEIRDIAMRYARGINRLDEELIKSCFHEDAVDDHGSQCAPAHAIAALLPDVVRSSFEWTFHMIGNSLIEIDGNRAFHEAYVLAYHRLLSGPDGTRSDVLFGGRYLSVHETRQGSAWLIAKRTVIHDWSRVDKVENSWPGADAFKQGVHTGNRQDLVFNSFTPHSEEPD